MSDEGSITRVISLMKEGDREAASRLWELYFRRLVGLARNHLRSAPRRAADEEDVALSVFDSFFRRAEQGRFPRLDDRDDLWQLLFVLTVRKSANLVNHENRRRRGGGRVALITDLDVDEAHALIGRGPTPQLAAQVADECRWRLEVLGDETLKLVAQWKMEAYTNSEIAGRLGCIEQTVERKLRTIRRIWGGDDQ